MDVWLFWLAILFWSSLSLHFRYSPTPANAGVPAGPAGGAMRRANGL
jgi:hypothetical protein